MACQELAPVRLRVMPSVLLRESARMTSREPVLLCMQIVPSPCSGSTETAVLGMIALTRSAICLLQFACTAVWLREASGAAALLQLTMRPTLTALFCTVACARTL